MSEATPEGQRMMARAQHYQDQLDGYAREQATRPQTIGYALADSPVGLAAWIYTLFQDVTDNDGDPEKAVDRDEILDDIMLYWLPNAAASAGAGRWVQVWWASASGVSTSRSSATSPTSTTVTAAACVRR
ncbi:hypothetical protein ACIA8K_25050 [Catenuloplanes sp. NPDC051500]|uniref:hypothetical protein n=1 Tax=Catenuloplanes sp. NPDC051500 TaxID=3363959 RepID=UPI0037A1D825